MRILLADAQTRVRAALRLLLEQEIEGCVFDEADRPAAVLCLARTIPPDILLLDWNLPGLSGAEFITVLKNESPHTMVIVLDSQPQSREAALKAGADDFVSKNDPPKQLVERVEQVRNRL